MKTLKDYSVLVVDDDPSWRSTVSDILQDYNVKVASSEDSAMETWLTQSNSSFDVAVLDMRLEDRDKCNQGGFDLARRIKRANQNCQIIILTGYADENSTRDALVDIQVADVLFKHPFEPHNLRIAVAEAIMTAIGEEDPVDLGDPEDVQLDSVRILHLSDLHFGANHIFQDSSSFPSRDIPTLRKVLMRSLRRHQNEPDIVIVSGDLVQTGDASEFDLALNFLEELLQDLEIESENIVVVPGNHDVRWGVPQDERFVTYRNLYRLFYHDLPASDDYFSRVRVFQIDNKPSVAVVGLDSCVIESSESPGIGYIGASQMERALSELHEKTEGCECFKIAVLHHHLIPVTSLRDLPNSENGEHISLVADAASVLSQMQREGFNLILHGHQHQPFFSRLIYGASNGEESHLAPLAIMGMGSAGVRIENKPNYYASIEINRSSTWEASVSWYRSEADPENTFVSDRQFSVAW